MANVIGDSAIREVAGVTGGNTAAGDGVWGQSDAGRGVVGVSKTGKGVVGESETYQGVYGRSRDNTGVVGESQSMHAVFGITHSTFAGVYGAKPDFMRLVHCIAPCSWFSARRSIAGL